jgi:pSer/pThr/pTyr-binding forkhead associated (FHA) protein
MITLVMKGNGAPQTLKLTVDVISVGRAKDNTISIQDKKVSRLHAKIERIGATYQIRDLESGNGTRINGRRVDFQTLSEGDEIRIGDATLTVQSFDEDDDEGEETTRDIVEKTPVPLPQKLQVKDKIIQVKNLNSAAPQGGPATP